MNFQLLKNQIHWEYLFRKLYIHFCDMYKQLKRKMSFIKHYNDYICQIIREMSIPNLYAFRCFPSKIANTKENLKQRHFYMFGCYKILQGRIRVCMYIQRSWTIKVLIIIILNVPEWFSSAREEGKKAKENGRRYTFGHLGCHVINISFHLCSETAVQPTLISLMCHCRCVTWDVWNNSRLVKKNTENVEFIQNEWIYF